MNLCSRHQLPPRYFVPPEHIHVTIDKSEPNKLLNHAVNILLPKTVCVSVY